MPYCPVCGGYHDLNSTDVCPSTERQDRPLSSWQCGSCGTNYPMWVSKCECSKKSSPTRPSQPYRRFQNAPLGLKTWEEL